MYCRGPSRLWLTGSQREEKGTGAQLLAQAQALVTGGTRRMITRGLETGEGSPCLLPSPLAPHLKMSTSHFLPTAEPQALTLLHFPPSLNLCSQVCVVERGRSGSTSRSGGAPRKGFWKSHPSACHLPPLATENPAVQVFYNCPVRPKTKGRSLTQLCPDKGHRPKSL